MNYGPLEFSDYLRRKQSRQEEPAEVRAARAAAPETQPANDRLSVICGPRALRRLGHEAQLDEVSVYEAIVDRSAGLATGAVCIRVAPGLRPLVLVLSSHQPVCWQLELAAGADLRGILLAGGGKSRVSGASLVKVSSIGGFCAFKPGSLEYHHLEREVLRCTGGCIAQFYSAYAGEAFEVGG